MTRSLQKFPKIDLVLVSSLKHTIQTWEIISSNLSYKPKEILISKDLQEVNFGKFNGVSKYLPEAEDARQNMKKDISFKPTGAESFQDTAKRVSTLFTTYKQKIENTNLTLIVGHGWINKTIIPILLNCTNELNFFVQNLPRQKNGQIVEIDLETRDYSFLPISW